MKITISKKPNYLEETISLINNVLELDENFNPEDIHIIKTPQNFSISKEELDSKFSDVLEYKKALFIKTKDVINKNIFSKLNILTTTAAGLKIPFLTSLLWELDETDADKLNDKLLLVAYLNLLLNDFYIKNDLDIKSVEKVKELSYKNSSWSKENVDIKLEEIIDLLSQLDYEESLKWFVLNQISDAEERIKFINYIKKIQSVVKENFYLVEKRFDETIKSLENPGEVLNRLNYIFGERIENVQGIVESPTLYVSVISYGSAWIKSVMSKDIKDAIYLGILIEELTKYSAKDSSISEKCKALGDPMRYKIIKILSERKCFVKELAEILEISSSTLSHHLSILFQNGFLSIEILDRKTFYKVKRESFQELSDYFKILSDEIKES